MSIRYPDMAALVLRLAFGSMMAFGHGYGKLLKLFSSEEIHFVTYFGLSAKTNLALTAFAEFICCIMIIIGYKTRLFCIPVIIAMFVAAFKTHLNDPLFMKHAESGSKEMALIYMAAFLAIYFLGSGRYSVDDRIDSVLN